MSPAVSESQRRLMCMALSMREGKTSYSDSKEAAKIAKSMTIFQLKEFCSKVEK